MAPSLGPNWVVQLRPGVQARGAVINIPARAWAVIVDSRLGGEYMGTHIQFADARVQPSRALAVALSLEVPNCRNVSVARIHTVPAFWVSVSGYRPLKSAVPPPQSGQSVPYLAAITVAHLCQLSVCLVFHKNTKIQAQGGRLHGRRGRGGCFDSTSLLHMHCTRKEIILRSNSPWGFYPFQLPDSPKGQVARVSGELPPCMTRGSSLRPLGHLM